MDPIAPQDAGLQDDIDCCQTSSVSHEAEETLARTKSASGKQNIAVVLKWGGLMPVLTLNAFVSGQLFRQGLMATIVMTTHAGRIAISYDRAEECVVFRRVEHGEFENLLPENNDLTMPEDIVSYCEDALLKGAEASVNNPKLRERIARLTAIKW